MSGATHTRKRDYAAIPQMSLGFHPENAEGVGTDQVAKAHKVMLEHYLEDIRNAAVSDSRREAIWEWIVDPLWRFGEPTEGFTFQACCQAAGVECYSTIRALLWQRRREVDRVFGRGAARRLMRRAEELIPVSEDIVRELGGAA